MPPETKDVCRCGRSRMDPHDMWCGISRGLAAASLPTYDALAARVAELEAALRPFVGRTTTWIGADYHGVLLEDCCISKEDLHGTPLTVADFKRADAVLCARPTVSLAEEGEVEKCRAT